MPIDVIQNVTTATVTTGGTTAPAAGTSQNWTVTAGSTWLALVTGVQVLRVIDLLDLGKTSGYEIMEVTVLATGTGVTWTVTRGMESTTPYAHAANWTVIPSPSAGSFDGRYGSIVAANQYLSSICR
jgi:hypothetical protein